MRTVKMTIFTISIFLLFAAASCKQFLADIDKDFSYWTSVSAITKSVFLFHTFTDTDGYPCVSSSGDIQIVFNVLNPRKYNFVMPNTPGAPSDVIRFKGASSADGVQGSPVFGTDYTLVQPAADKLLLTYKKAFLQKNEYGTADIGAAVSLYADDGRKLNSYDFKLRANTPPAAPEYLAMLKTAAPDTGGKHYYVLCFKAEGINKTMGPGFLHSDLAHIFISRDDGAEVAYPLTFNSSNSDFDISASAGALVNSAQTAQLVSGTDTLPGMQTDSVQPGSWIIRLKTDVPIGGPKVTYRIRLSDGKLYSDFAEKTTNKIRLPAPQIFAHSSMNSPVDSGVYTKSGATEKPGNNDVNGGLSSADGSTADSAIPVYSAYGADVNLKVNKESATGYPEGVRIRGRVSLVSGTSASPSFIEGTGGSSGAAAEAVLPAAGETVYKLETWAEGAGFETSGTYIRFYRVVKAVSSDTDSEVSLWKILKKAVEEKTDDGGTVIVSGTIGSKNGGGSFGEIVINKNITVKGKTGKDTDILDANKSSFGSNPHRIFNVRAGKKLTLDGLTLKNGKNADSNGMGGGILSGGHLDIRNTIVEFCESQNSFGGGIAIGTSNGAVHIRMENVIIRNNIAAKAGGGLYIGSSNSGSIASDSVFKQITLTENRLSENGSNTGGAGIAFIILSGASHINLESFTINNNDADRAEGGGGIYIRGTASDKARLTLSGSSVLKENKANIGGAVYLQNGSFIMKGSSYLAPGTLGKNSIYLADHQVVTVDGHLSLPAEANDTAALIATSETSATGGYTADGTKQVLNLINAANQADCNLFKLARATSSSVTGEAGSGFVSTKYGIRVSSSDPAKGVIVISGTSGNILPYEPSPYAFVLNPTAPILFSPGQVRTVTFTLKKKGGANLDSGTQFKLKMELYQSGSSLAAFGEGVGIKTGAQNENDISITLPPALPAGTYRLYLKAEVGVQVYDGWQTVTIN